MFKISLFNYCRTNIDNYVYKDNCIFEFVLFNEGFVISKRNIKPIDLDFYDIKEDKIYQDKGFQRITKKYIFIKKFKFFSLSSLIRKNFKIIKS